MAYEISGFYNILKVIYQLQNKDFSSPMEIVDEMCRLTNMERNNILSNSKIQKYCLSRQGIHYLMRSKLGISYQDIAEETAFNGKSKNHGTIIHSVRRIKGYLETYKPRISLNHEENTANSYELRISNLEKRIGELENKINNGK